MSYLIQKETLTRLADKIREKTGGNDELSMEYMILAADFLMDDIDPDDVWLKPIIERTIVDVELPDDLTKIRDYAFAYCKNLALTSLPDGVTSIGDHAFDDSNIALTSLPDGVTSIGRGTFAYCKNLALTSLPDGVTSIGDYAFRNCTNLALTTLPASVTSIGYLSFYDCSNIKTITFLGIPTTIDSAAFRYCYNLTSIKVPWAEGAVAGAPWEATNAVITYNYVEES